MTSSSPKSQFKNRFDIYFNKTTVADLFEKYEDIGFIYPVKKEFLAPHYQQIKSNWEKLQDTAEDLLWMMTNDQNKEKHFASISVWKSSNYGLLAQHLVSDGNPFLSLKVMLAAQYRAEHYYDESQVRSSQNWFRPDNRYAFRIFASMFKKLGEEKASLLRFEYLHLPLEKIVVQNQTQFDINEVTGIDAELISFVKKQYGNVFVRAEELDQEDIQLKKIADDFKKYGIDRSRKVFKIKNKKSQKVIACIIANRGPIGLNFSFFENRAYYILDKNLTEKQRVEILPAMHEQIKPYYSDFEFQKIPIATDEKTSEVLQLQGAHFFKTYMQSIWMREGFAQWYEHIESFLQRIEKRMVQKAA
ncbi:MAG: hypothetical protein AB8H03_19875 [Saprospiraceae bacterium]